MQGVVEGEDRFVVALRVRVNAERKTPKRRGALSFLLIF